MHLAHSGLNVDLGPGKQMPGSIQGLVVVADDYDDIFIAPESPWKGTTLNERWSRYSTRTSPRMTSRIHRFGSTSSTSSSTASSVGSETASDCDSRSSSSPYLSSPGSSTKSSPVIDSPVSSTSPVLSTRRLARPVPAPLPDMSAPIATPINRTVELQDKLDVIRRRQRKLTQQRDQLAAVLDNRIELYKHDAQTRQSMRERRTALAEQISLLDRQMYETGLALTREFKRQRQSGASDFWVQSR